MTKKISIDTSEIWITVILLTTFGLIMVYSASGIQFINSDIHGNDSMYLFKRQFLFIALGFVACLFCQFINYSILYRAAKIGYLIGIISIFLLKTSMGVSAKGATRWLNILGVQFQVAELIKICVIIILAYMIQHYSKHLGKIQLLFRMWLIGGGAAVLLMIISNDLSSSRDNFWNNVYLHPNRKNPFTCCRHHWNKCRRLFMESKIQFTFIR